MTINQTDRIYILEEVHYFPDRLCSYWIHKDYYNIMIDSINKDYSSSLKR